MPDKYVIHTRTVPHRFETITRSGIIAWEEGCLKCAVCVKKQCVYGVYDNRHMDTRQMVDSIDNQCMNCFRCVQNCPKELINKSINPEFKALGDSHWTPDIIARLWYQAETGKIPVSGAGYPGPFSGPGFDSMWTDMSEIVRPTRDGIHGREYISTAVDLGKTPRSLGFNDSGELDGDLPRVIDIPLPIILRVPSFGSFNELTIEGWSIAARSLGTFLALPDTMIKRKLDDFRSHLIPSITPGQVRLETLTEGIRLVEISLREGWENTVQSIGASHPDAMISMRLPLVKEVEKKILIFLEAGVSIFHLEATDTGRAADDNSLSIKDIIRSVHLSLVEEGIRDEITLLVSGGISMAEHVAKSIICGADAVFVDFPILIALECRMCRRCTKDLSCPVEIDKASSAWVALRTVNLFGAWHNQLLEVMGAMGMRDARRLRGEAGRAMFFEELDRFTFQSLGTAEEGCELE
jgi:ferredoxin